MHRHVNRAVGGQDDWEPTHAAEYSGEGALMLSGARTCSGGLAPDTPASTPAATTANARVTNFGIVIPLISRRAMIVS
jgi:hypothetical protein